MAGSGATLSARRLIADFAGFAGARIVVALLLVLAGSLLEALGLIGLVGAFRLAVAPASHSGFAPLDWLLVHFSDAARLTAALGLFAALVVLRGVALTLRDSLLAALQFGYVEQLRAALLDRIERAPWPVVARVRPGRIVQALTGDIQQVGTAAYHALQAAVALVTALGFGALAVLISPRLALALTVLAPGAFAALPLLRRAARLGGRLAERNQRMTDQLVQLLAGMKSAKAQDLDRAFLADIRAASDDVLHARLGFIRLQSMARNLWFLLAAGAGIGAAALGMARLGSDPAMTIAFLLLVSRITGPVLALHQGIQLVLQNAASFDALTALGSELAAPPRSTPAHDGASGTIALLGAAHAHRPGAGVGPIDLILPQGMFLGLTGPSGAGKTTLADLIAGLIPPQSGQILRAGKPLTGAMLARHRAALGHVAQDAALFGDTLRRSFHIAAPHAREAEMHAMLALVDAEPIVARLAGGLDAPIAARDASISSGERQRLALACALLRRPTLLILDEATNALDIASEARILARIAALDPRPTIVMIAHRPDGLALCDQVLTLPARGLSPSSMARDANDDRAEGSGDRTGDAGRAPSLGAAQRQMGLAVAGHRTGRVAPRADGD